MPPWNIMGISHKGWKCMDVLDLADEIESGEEIRYEQCEMCGIRKLQYIHVMKHQDFPEELHAGCACAEKVAFERFEEYHTMQEEQEVKFCMEQLRYR
ncbi:MAG: hypothetical protein K2N01_07010 [Lachnospiraceae bacterium]|nr:hypothetical protein [Lachnospiraceae bacterium]